MNLDPSRYADLFRTESREQLSAINRALLELEGGGDHAEPLSVIFRAVHTVKGMSATMGFHALAEFAHDVESLLDRIRRGEQRLTRELMDALFAAADALESGLDSATEDAPRTTAMATALTRMRDAAGGSGASGVVATPGPESGAPADDAGADPMDGPGVIVRVRQSAGVLLPGVRAFLVVEKARALGEVAAVSPAIALLQVAETPQAFALRLVTTASAEEIERAIRAAGDVERVEVDASGGRRQRASREQRAGEVTPEDATRAGAGAARSIRMDLARLDALMNLIGELVITRGRLLQLTAGNGDPALDEEMQRASRLIGDLHAEIVTSRMVPVWQVFDRFPRLVRDAARQLDKEVSFVVLGREIELDRSLLDEVGEPVVHLLRNAVDHGIETPAERGAAGKPRAGRLELAAARDRAAVIIRVSDDGRGIDRAKVLAQAKAKGLVGAETAQLDDDQLFRCIALPGFTTAEQVSGLSGRGVGIDAVQTKVRALGGSVALVSVEGEGTEVTIRLPVTLAIIRAVLARSGAERYALPLAHVRETLEYGAGTVQRVKGKEVLVLRDEVLPLLYLRDVVRQEGAGGTGGEIVVLERGERRSGLVVDELVGQEEIVVKQFDAARDGLALFSGATILADGAPALIMDVGSLFQGA
ncbi:MAG TPA: chemotaxis protein CheA [Gemmatimonadaceae bacterium]|nr:chemotaxis protein CheA [Gemmatimonadaceae bacterium]